MVVWRGKNPAREHSHQRKVPCAHTQPSPDLGCRCPADLGTEDNSCKEGH